MHPVNKQTGQPFQSSPTSKGGRWDPHDAQVSILAHLERWALLPRKAALVSRLRCFNPRPPRKVGATLRLRTMPSDPLGFNPRPPRKVGATGKGQGSDRRLRVSILAHLERWALHKSPNGRPLTFLFQSSPTSKGGRYRAAQSRRVRVSQFQSSPTSKGGRYPVSLSSTDTSQGFQSSPTSKGGRYGHVSSPLRSCRRFNPRPPRKVGATFRPAQCPCEPNSFNPRPPRKVGATMWTCQSSPTSKGGATCKGTFEFQSSPTSKGGRYAPTCADTSPFLLFQSSPTSKGGRYIVQFSQSNHLLLVSILAHLERWALRCPRR